MYLGKLGHGEPECVLFKAVSACGADGEFDHPVPTGVESGAGLGVVPGEIAAFLPRYRQVPGAVLGWLGRGIATSVRQVSLQHRFLQLSL